MSIAAGIPKPAGSTWTDDQWSAISLHGHSMLVAAAAGSGKTAVLVERIIRSISDEQNPMDVDRLLVATFTKAAAAEMRHRISAALEKALDANPVSEHLRRQLALLPRASITTLHSFCMEVIQRHYQRINLDPGFRIANETESAIMRQETLEELLEERYGQSSEEDPLWHLADSFSGDKSDDALLSLIQRLYDDSRSHPWPEQWIEGSVRMFEQPGGLDRSPWIRSLTSYVRVELTGIVAVLEEAARASEEPGGPVPYLANLQDDISQLRSVLGAAHEGGWDSLYHAVQSVTFGKLKACRGDGYDKDLQERVKELRSDAKDRLADLREECFGRPPEQYEEELLKVAPLMRTLADLVTEFGRRYTKAKRDKSLVDFSDLEHYCLRILCSEDAGPGCLVPSSAAEEYREQFIEVLLDEYQDTNRVQEAIVELISSPAPGNRFMVGDVKQSIYRFRLAEPGLFQEKYKSYRLDGTEPGQRIDLARNFRSRREVVDGTNYIFRQLMNETVGEIAYDERAELVYGAGYPEEQAGDRFHAELVLLDRSSEDTGTEEQPGDAEQEAETPGDTWQNEAAELETAQLEARYIAGQIRSMMAVDGGRKFQVYDKESGGTRDIQFRDIVILLRATSQWGPKLIEELKLQGIPGYAELNTGYFNAVEVQTLLSLLRIIDNPFQDIPLASVLRSPLVDLDEEGLAHIRICRPHGAYYDAVRAYARKERPLEQEAAASQETGQPAGTGEFAAGIQGQAPSALWGTGERSAVSAPGTEAAEDFEESADAAPSCEAEEQGAFPRREEVRAKLADFLVHLRRWRAQAQQGSVADLVWDIYRQTGYFDFVGGLPGGTQRQANLRALYDRARQYESTSFRGLFRFLRFIERMQTGGGDLGTARALGEQEDVVRIMTIHKSKGLEFPVVFVAGIAKMFNRRDLTDPFLLHKELGFGPKLMDPGTRVSYPTLPWLAIRRRIGMEMLAEEMRVLYVALTRAREKLILLGSLRSVEKTAKSWARFVRHEGAVLPDDALAKARSYLDWIGPAVIRHPHAEPLRAAADVDFEERAFLNGEPSAWTVRLVRADLFAGLAEAAPAVDFSDPKWQQLFKLEPVSGTEKYEREVWQRLNFTYAYPAASHVLSKTSVTELKRLSEHHKLLESLSEEPSPNLWAEAGGRAGTLAAGPAAEGAAQSSSYRPVIVRRPRFLEQSSSNAAERGTVFHAVMQHIALDRIPALDDVKDVLARMVEKELLTVSQMELVDPEVILTFFHSEIGSRLLRAGRVQREVPFSYGMPAGEVYADSGEAVAEETVMLQGVIDCLIEEDDGYVLLDYKTDRLKGGSPSAAAEKYRLQLELYAKAIEAITKRRVTAKYIFLFDGAHVIAL